MYKKLMGAALATFSVFQIQASFLEQSLKYIYPLMNRASERAAIRCGVRMAPFLQQNNHCKDVCVDLEFVEKIKDKDGSPMGQRRNHILVSAANPRNIIAGFSVWYAKNLVQFIEKTPSGDKITVINPELRDLRRKREQEMEERLMAEGNKRFRNRDVIPMIESLSEDHCNEAIWQKDAYWASYTQDFNGLDTLALRPVGGSENREFVEYNETTGLYSAGKIHNDGAVIISDGSNYKLLKDKQVENKRRFDFIKNKFHDAQQKAYFTN